MARVDPADVHTLIGAYALDALDADERAAFERHLAQCEPCREEAAGLRLTAVRLADAAAVAPAPEVRERVLQQVAVTPQIRDAPATPQRPGRTESGRSRVWMAAAAVLAVVSVGLGGLAWSQYRTAQDARATTDAVARILGDPSARVVTQTLPNGATARLVVAQDRAVLAGDALPALASDRAYQLWVVRGKQITSAGMGPSGADAGGSWSRVVDGVQRGDVVALSVEPSGGSSQPTTTPVVTLAVA